MKWYIRAFRKYAVFSGRDSRKAFWMFYWTDMNVRIAILLASFLLNIFIIALLVLYLAVSVLPWIAAHVRRFHDLGYSGWHLLMLRIPTLVAGFLGVSWLAMVLGARTWMIWALLSEYSFLLYFIILLSVVSEIGMHIMLALPGEPGPNRYGPPPEE